MEIKFADTFFKSLERMVNRQKWYWKTWDFIRYDLPNGVKNIFFFWKVIWRYRSWDSSFQMRILARSLEPIAHTLEHHGNEVDGPRLKKVAKIKRAIEILNRQSNDDYIELAEEALGYKVNLSYGIFGNKEEEDEPSTIKEMNSKIYDLSHKLEEEEWKELWTIFNGQEHSHYVMLLDKAKSQNIDLKTEDVWDKWFDGSGMKGWWD
jgi:hypothetical protein